MIALRDVAKATKLSKETSQPESKPKLKPKPKPKSAPTPFEVSMQGLIGRLFQQDHTGAARPSDDDDE